MHILFFMRISPFVSFVRTFVRLSSAESGLVSKSRLLLIARKLNTMLLICFLGGVFLPLLKKIEKFAEAIGTS